MYFFKVRSRTVMGECIPSTLAREVNRYNETFVNKGRALGELGHPDGPTVNLDRVSHKITSLVQEGNNFRGKAQILSTPMGKIASSLLDEGVMLGVSSRGVGSLQTTSEGCKLSVKISSWQLLLISSLTLPLLTLLLMELWKEESGFGKEESFANNSLHKPRRELTLSLIKEHLKSISWNYSTISSQIFDL